MSETAFPLQWPMGWPRTAFPGFSKFGERQRGDVSMSRALDFLEAELGRLGAQHFVISTNVSTRLDGRPYANQGRPKDTGVAVYFTVKGKRVVLACDKWNRPECNLWAIGKHVEALRGQQRWGVGSVEQAFADYAALVRSTGPSCWEVLGLEPDATEEKILRAWRTLAASSHPDKEGGSHDAMAALNDAKDIALATRRAEKGVA